MADAVTAWLAHDGESLVRVIAIEVSPSVIHVDVDASLTNHDV